jgi:hypothetical protein
VDDASAERRRFAILDRTDGRALGFPILRGIRDGVRTGLAPVSPLGQRGDWKCRAQNLTRIEVLDVGITSPQ